MARVLLAFLGAGKYDKITYVIEDSRYETQYVIEALARHICNKWKEEDRICLFLTKEANEVYGESIKSILEKITNASFVPVDIPSGRSIEELDEIFEKIVGSLKKGDEVYVDVTHGFRFLPLLLLSALNFARITRGIKIAQVFYGLYEKGKESSPILDITYIVRLSDFAAALSEFVKYGNASRVRELIRTSLGELLKRTKGGIGGKIRDLGDRLQELSLNIATCRGKEISRSISAVYEQLEKAQEDMEKIPRSCFNKILSELIQYVREHIMKNLSRDPRYAWVSVIRWCANHNLYQQGYTFLRELVISDVMKMLKLPEKGLFEREPRETISIMLGEIKESMGDADIAKIWNQITQYRNDINHAGCSKNAMSAHKIISKLSELVDEYEKYSMQFLAEENNEKKEN